MDKFAPFKNRTEYQQALFRFNHPQHKEAMELRENRLHPKSDFKLSTVGYPSLDNYSEMNDYLGI
mgnify:CR=1 FL=1